VLILLAAVIAFILFVSGVASNLVAEDLKEIVKPYRWIVWVLFGIACITAVGTAIWDQTLRREGRPVPYIGELHIPRVSHFAVKLQDGRVLILGGNLRGQRLTNTEIFDPAQSKFLPAGALTRHFQYLS